jgi:hypothetical protein
MTTDDDLPRIADLTTALAMRSLHECQPPDAGDMLLELHNALVTDADGQKLLFTHAHTLNAFYHRLLACAVARPGPGGADAPPVNERMATLALQAQKQCLQTVAALATLRMIEKNAAQTEGHEE